MILLDVAKLEKWKLHCKLSFGDENIVSFKKVPNYNLFVLSSACETFAIGFANGCKFLTPSSGKITAFYLNVKFQMSKYFPIWLE